MYDGMPELLGYDDVVADLLMVNLHKIEDYYMCMDFCCKELPPEILVEKRDA